MKAYADQSNDEHELMLFTVIFPAVIISHTICYYSCPGMSADAIVWLPGTAPGTTLQSATFKCNVIETHLRP